MITLTYDENCPLTEYPISEDLPDLPLAVLDETCYLLPIALTVDGVELLKLGDSRYTALPVLLVALRIRWQVEKMGPSDSAVAFLTDAGKMHLRRAGKRVYISTSLHREEVEGDYEELCAALRDFALEVKSYMLVHAPEIAEHPEWGDWWDFLPP